jgi:glucosylceramidase
MVTAAQNEDGSIAVVVFNEGDVSKNFSLSLNKKTVDIKISEKAIQTIIIPN